MHHHQINQQQISTNSRFRVGRHLRRVELQQQILREDGLPPSVHRGSSSKDKQAAEPINRVSMPERPREGWEPRSLSRSDRRNTQDHLQESGKERKKDSRRCCGCCCRVGEFQRPREEEQPASLLSCEAEPGPQRDSEACINPDPDPDAGAGGASRTQARILPLAESGRQHQVRFGLCQRHEERVPLQVG